MRGVCTWLALGVAVGAPLWIAAASPLLAWRDPAYNVAAFAGVVALTILLVQPLLALDALPNLRKPNARRIHKGVGGVLVCAVVLHVGGLWLTSPPDVIDALLFRSPTPFAAWGVVSMWMLFCAAALVALKRKLRMSTRSWRMLHKTLVSVVAVSTVIHAILIEGTMGVWSKYLLCGLVLGAVAYAWLPRGSARRQASKTNI